MPSVGSDDVARVARKLGWQFDRRRGSHEVYKKDGVAESLVIVANKKDLKRGTLGSMLRTMGLTLEDFERLR